MHVGSSYRLDYKGHPGPHILDFNFKSSFQIVSLFHMYIDMGEMKTGEQDRPSLIIENSPK